MTPPLARRLLAEFLGSAFLAAVVIGSGNRGGAALPQRRRTSAVRERSRNCGGPVHDHPHVRPGLGRSLQPGRLPRGRELRWARVARCPCLHPGPGQRLYRRGDHRERDVRAVGDQHLDKTPGLGGAPARRGRRDARPHPGDLLLGPYPARLDRAGCRGRLHRCRLLLHQLHQLRQSGDHRRADVLRHICGDRPGIGAGLRDRAAGRWSCRDRGAARALSGPHLGRGGGGDDPARRRRPPSPRAVRPHRLFTGSARSRRTFGIWLQATQLPGSDCTFRTTGGRRLPS